MHPIDMFILLSTGTAIGWSSAIYVNNDFRLMIAYIIGCPIASAIGGILIQDNFPEYGKVGLIGGAILGAILFRFLAQYIFSKYLKKAEPD